MEFSVLFQSNNYPQRFAKNRNFHEVPNSQPASKNLRAKKQQRKTRDPELSSCQTVRSPTKRKQSVTRPTQHPVRQKPNASKPARTQPDKQFLSARTDVIFGQHGTTTRTANWNNTSFPRRRETRPLHNSTRSPPAKERRIGADVVAGQRYHWSSSSSGISSASRAFRCSSAK
jgi:hypothetical protein